MSVAPALVVTPSTPTIPQLPERLSMSFMQDTTRCLRMAQLGKEADTSDELASVGRSTHQAAATAGMTAKLRGVESLPADVLEQCARNVLRRPDETGATLSPEGWLEVIRLTRKLATWADGDPPPFPLGGEYEVLQHRELDGQTLSARIDWRWIDGTVCWIKDFKSGGKQAAKEPTFQGRFYAWETLGGHPWITEFWLSEHALPYGPPRWVWVDADDIAGWFEDYLSDQVARVVAAYAAGELPPTPGSWCNTMCPDRAGCPLPEWAKGMPLRSDADATAALKTVIVLRARARELTADLRGYVDDHERTHITTGDQEYGYGADGAKCEIRKARQEE